MNWNPTDKQYNNLKELLNKLPEFESSELDLKMEQYVSIGGLPMVENPQESWDIEERNYCGTACCLMGYSSFIFTDKDNVPAWTDIDNTTSWGTLCEDIFGIGFDSLIWDFLFSSHWENDFTHAAHRIQCILDDKKLPQLMINMCGEHEIISDDECHEYYHATPEHHDKRGAIQ